MFAPLPTPAEMAEWDRRAVREFGLRGEMLMENACRESLAVLRRELGPLSGKSAVLFAGPGNNGGDAMGLARCLHDSGARVRILHTRPKSTYKREAGYHLSLARKAGLSMVLLQRVNLDTLPRADIVVDGLLGTGFTGMLRPEYLAWVRTINALATDSFILALDIPSGLDGLTGQPRPEAVRAHATVTFEAAKPGLMEPSARAFVGRLHVRPIGIPRSLRESAPATHFAITPRVLDLVDPPSPLLHKGRAGHVLIIGGSDGLTGAPALAALGALRAGTGLVSAACPAGIMDSVKAGFFECMTLPLGRTQDQASQPGMEAGTRPKVRPAGDVSPHGAGGPPPSDPQRPWPRNWNRDMARELAEHLPRFQGLVLGPGLGRSHGAHEFLEKILPVLPAGCVLDADALFWLAQDPSLKSRLPANVILTPHLGEMARLTGLSVAEIETNRAEVARSLAQALGAVVVLKGPCTLVAAPGGDTHVSPIMAPCLAVGGSGDVLSGIIGAARARGLAPLPSACLGVYWHGLCGQYLEKTYPRRGALAREIADALPQVLKEPPHAESQRHHDR